MEALDHIQSIRELHLQRPSGMWTDQDLLAYQAFIFIRMVDILSAEKILDRSADTQSHGLSQLLQAEILLAKEQAEGAEEKLRRILSEYPNGILSIPLMRVRLLLARALFEQHKINQALQVMKDAIRLAAPERFLRPFLQGDTMCTAMLSLVLQTESMTNDAQASIREGAIVGIPKKTYFHLSLECYGPLRILLRQASPLSA